MSSTLGEAISFIILGVSLSFFVFIIIPRDEHTPIKGPKKKFLLPKLPFKYTLNTSKAAYVREVGLWCYEFLGKSNKITKPPIFELSYYFHKSKHGHYISGKKIIRIYVNNHQSIEKLTDTIIHEYIHFLEIKTTQHQKEYNAYHKKVGYLKNPYEISARNKAAEYTATCMEHMREKKYLLG